MLAEVIAQTFVSLLFGSACVAAFFIGKAYGRRAERSKYTRKS